MTSFHESVLLYKESRGSILNMSRVKLNILAPENGDVQVILQGRDKRESDQSQITPDDLRLPEEADMVIYHNRCCFPVKKQSTKTEICKDIEHAKCDEMNQMKENRVRKLWKDFLGCCTLHGFHYCFEGELPLRRIIWSLLLIGAFSMFVEKCTDSVIHFLQYPFNTATVIDYTNRLDFPAVSLCNFNDARMSKINGTTLDLKLRAKMAGEDYSKYNIPGEEMTKTLERATHLHSDMILSCKWNERNCSWANFTLFKNADEDVCYTFNSAKEGKAILQTENTGEKYGLELTIDIQHFDYYFTAVAGMKVILHDQVETPVKMQGYSVAPGFTTYFSLKKRMVSVR